VKCSEHGHRHVLPPSREGSWIEDSWRWMLHDVFGFDATPPAWLDTPAVARLTVTTPDILKRLQLATPDAT
jgi:hypothetical protein